MEKQMSLGKKLAVTLEAARVAKVRAEDLADAKRREEIERVRVGRAVVIENIRETVTGKIEAGLVPTMRIKDYDKQRWLRECQAGKAGDIDLFEGLQAWAASNDIGLVFAEDHDGVGMESWITVKVVPVEPDSAPSPM
ncbi:hypothetical protein [Paracoccus sp. ME4]|uniref:hypothetical protein n=1 Tax=Paracoccus sp. ME4 TaxID=3138066 RepID=UPI00398B4DD4